MSERSSCVVEAEHDLCRDLRELVAAGRAHAVARDLPSSSADPAWAGRLVSLARDLRSDEGENFEYDRALVELVTAVLGVDPDDRDVVVRLLGVGGAHLDPGRSAGGR